MKMDEMDKLAMQKRILLLALTGWDCAYKDKTLAELDSQGVLAERDWLLAELDKVQTRIDELIQERTQTAKAEANTGKPVKKGAEGVEDGNDNAGTTE
jgi:hypothetical protein